MVQFLRESSPATPSSRAAKTGDFRPLSVFAIFMAKPRPQQMKLAGFDDVSGEQSDQKSCSESGLLTEQTVYLVDAHALIYQVFHALPEMTSPTGQPVAAVHGFIRDIIELLENKKPNHLVCAFDRPGKTFRHELYGEYKIQREEMPDDLRPQIPNIRRMLEAMGVLAVDCPTFEADDILATLASQVDQMRGECFVVTTDKDCRQLITDRVKIYNIRTDQIFDANELMKTWGVRPEQVVDFQALVGDSVDNVPGVPLIGPKLARELLEKYDTLEDVLEHAAEVPGKKRSENLIRYKEQALLSRRLVRLVKDVPIDLDWTAARVGGANPELVQKLCREFGFRGLGQRLADMAPSEAPRKWDVDYRTVVSVDELKQLVDEMLKQDCISIDTETTSSNPRWSEIVGYSFAWNEGEAFYVPVKSPVGDPQLDADATREALRPLLENPTIRKIGQNLKFDIVVLRTAGIELQGVSFDTMVADYLLLPGERSHDLDALSDRYLNHQTIKITELIGKGKKQRRMHQVPVEFVATYAAEDVDVPLRLLRILGGRLERRGLSDLFHQLEMPLIQVLAEMEFNGIRVDVERLSELGRRFAQRINELETEIHEIAGSRFNIDSPPQLAHVLFDKLELPVIKRTKTGPSTDVEVLTALAAMDEGQLPAKVIEYRQNAKLKSTYVDALTELVHPATGRVHSSFKQDVAATGRLSSKDPNLQNIPIRTAAGREIRSAFLPQDGWKLLSADYSQIELRVLAHFSGDEVLQAAFSNDEDIHARIASEVYGVALDEVSSQMRRSAKAINFGIIYGQSPFGLAKALDISKDEAAEFIEAYFARYPGVEKFMQKVLDQCHGNGYVNTISGRRRPVHGVRSPAYRGVSLQRNLPERIAINTVIQGSAADLIKQAMIDLFQRLRQEKLHARMLLQIHDELVFEVPPEELPVVTALVDHHMSQVRPMEVPLKVDLKTGDNWAECEPWV